MATVDRANWDEKNTATTQTLSDSTSVSGLQKVQPIKIVEGTTSGTGDVAFSSSTWDNITNASDIVVLESDESTTRAYEIESLDTTAREAWIWVYGSWNSGSTEMVVAAGTGDGTDYSTGGTGANPWSQTGINAGMVQHFNESNYPTNDALDSTSNGNDASITGGTSTGGDLNGSLNLDGSDDNGVVTASSTINPANITLVAYTEYTGTKTKFNSLARAENEGGALEQGYLIQFDNSGDEIIQAQVHDGSSKGQAFDSTGFPTNEKVSVGFTYDGADLVLYRDGEPAGISSSVSGNISYTSPQDLAIGSVQPNRGTGNLWEGLIEEMRVFTEAKNQEWWLAEYDASPKGGQTFFSWSGPEPTTDPLSGNVTVEGANQANVEVVVYNKTQDFLEGLTTTDSNSDFSIPISKETDEYYVGYFYDDGTTFYASGETTNP